MMSTTSTTPTIPARIPSAMESLPSDGPMVRSSTIVSGAGRAPARSTRARSCASCSGLLPSSICPCWPIWLLMTGGWPCTAVQDDRHVVVDVPSGLALENPPAAPGQGEGDQRLVRERVARRGRLLELLAGDDRAVFHGVERAVGARRPRYHLGAPPQLDAPWHQALDLGASEQALGHRHLLLGHEELSGELPLVEQRGERAGGVGLGGVRGGRLPFATLGFAGVRAEELRHRGGGAPRSRGLHARLAQRPVDLGKGVAEQVAHVGDAELEKRGALNDALRPRRVLLAREL